MAGSDKSVMVRAKYMAIRRGNAMLREREREMIRRTQAEIAGHAVLDFGDGHRLRSLRAARSLSAPPRSSTVSGDPTVRA